MPMLLAADMNAINRYIMTTPIKTDAAKKVQIEWINFWQANEKSFLWYTQEEFDRARNIKRTFDMANAPSAAAKKAVQDVYSNSITSEEARGEVKRSTAEGVYIVPEEPFVPVRLQVLGWSAAAVLALGYAGVKYVSLTSPTRFIKKAKRILL